MVRKLPIIEFNSNLRLESRLQNVTDLSDTFSLFVLGDFEQCLQVFNLFFFCPKLSIEMIDVLVELVGTLRNYFFSKMSGLGFL